MKTGSITIGVLTVIALLSLALGKGSFEISVKELHISKNIQKE